MNLEYETETIPMRWAVFAVAKEPTSACCKGSCETSDHGWYGHWFGSLESCDAGCDENAPGYPLVIKPGRPGNPP